MENKLKNWMLRNRVKAIDLARRTNVTRQTIAKLINNDFVQVDRVSLKKVKEATGITYDELLSDGESGTYHRRTGIAKLDTVIEDLLHDLHTAGVKDKYAQYIDPEFYCSSPWFLSRDLFVLQGVEAELKGHGSAENQRIMAQIRNEGWISWSDMCSINQPDEKTHQNSYIVVDSIDMIGNYRRIDQGQQLQVTARSVIWEGDYSKGHTTTILSLGLDRNFGEIMAGSPWKIKSWVWYDVNTEQL
jgi:transcriptional regulator with XRE-family HTH domain